MASVSLQIMQDEWNKVAVRSHGNRLTIATDNPLGWRVTFTGRANETAGDVAARLIGLLQEWRLTQEKAPCPTCGAPHKP